MTLPSSATPPAAPPLSTRARRGFVVVMLALLFVPAALLLARRPDAGEVTTEKRTRAPKPTFKEASLWAFLDAWTHYANDNFLLRDRIVKAYSFIKIKGLRISPTEKVIIGNDGWLFYSGIGDGSDMRDFRGTLPIEAKDLAASTAAFEARRKKLATLGIPFVVMVAPNKQTIYNDYVPYQEGHLGHITRADQFIWDLRSRSQVHVLDPRDNLRIEKSKGTTIYYKTDSHWNMRGALIGYDLIAQELQARVPGFHALSRQEVTFKDGPRPAGDLALLMGLPEAFDEVEPTPNLGAHPTPVRVPDEVLGYAHYDNPDKSLPRAVVLGDSFSTALLQYLGIHFSHVSFANFLWYGYDEAWVLAQRPNVVIIEIVERGLPGR